jgi:signal transduction histidine kinase
VNGATLRIVAVPRRSIRGMTARTLALLFLMYVIFQFQVSVHAQENKRVLVLYEMDRSTPAVERVDRTLRGVLSGQPIDLYVEFMQTNLFRDASSQQRVLDGYRRKYQNRSPNVIIAIGANPAQALLHARKSVFAGIPLIVCGSTEDLFGISQRENNFTGSWMRPDFMGTLEVALKLRPKTRNVFVVNGSGAIDTSLDAGARRSFQDIHQGIAFTYLGGLVMSDLLERLRGLPDQSVVLFGAITEDATGKQYFVATQSLPLVIQAANAPVFVMADTLVGNGAAGGSVMSYADQGRLAGEDALSILRGEAAADIPVAMVSNSYVFDAQVLRRWGMDRSRLPVGRILLNEPAGFSRRLFVSLFLFTMLVAAIAVIGLQRMRSRSKRLAQLDEGRASDAMRLDLTRRLLNAQEGERTRIARELHDGIGQEIALLGIQIQKPKGAGSDPDDGRQTLEELGSRLSSIGTKVSNLSHHLHSSELEILGLAVAATKLCRELSADSKIQFTCSSTGIDINLDREVALSCFRLFQECLHNVTKHSHASAATVTLTQRGGELTIVVHDNGVGFDLSEARKTSGLGLVSMKERMNVIGGQFDIASEPGNGTTVTARVPLKDNIPDDAR